MQAELTVLAAYGKDHGELRKCLAEEGADCLALSLQLGQEGKKLSFGGS